MINEAFRDANSAYYNQEKRFLLHLIPDGPNVVMDLGCGAGRVGKTLLECNKAAEVVGVELFEPAAKEAMKYYKTVHIGDVEELELSYRGYFDVVICGDILEHLKEPRKVVGGIYRWLKNGGRIVCCIPNVRNWRIWADLVFRGNWEYTSEGILDQTHLRFYTRRSFRRLLMQASFVVEREDIRIGPGPKQQAFNRATLGVFKDFFAYQLLFSARKI